MNNEEGGREEIQKKILKEGCRRLDKGKVGEKRDLKTRERQRKREGKRPRDKDINEEGIFRGDSII